MGVQALVRGAAPSAPDLVVEAIGELAEALGRAAGENLVALVLYGGLARGSYRPGASDVNLAIVLADAAPARVAALAPALQAAWRAARVEPWIVGLAELPRLFALFPTKLLDLQARHVLLAGTDPFQGLGVPEAQVRARAEQSLTNLALRLRRRLVAATGDGDAQARWLAEVARPLAAELAPLLRLAGAHPGRDDTADLLAAAAGAFGLDGATLAELAEARKSPGAVADPAGLFERAVAAVSAAAAAAAPAKVGGA